MKKRVLIIALLCCAGVEGRAQAIRPVYDKSKHYQWRSVETGPWKFSPKWYYKIFYNKYRKNYSPNISRRAAATAAAIIEAENYANITEEIESWNNEEVAKMADRQIDLIDPLLGDKYEAVNSRISKSLSECLAICYQIDDSERDDRVQNVFFMANERSRLCENIDIISKSYIDNGKRLEGYIETLDELDKLNSQLNTFKYVVFNSAKNKGFI